jgi:hypothetical protein
MSPESRRVAGAVLIILPSVMIGGASILSLLVGNPHYIMNPIRQDLWRAGHAHAGVLLLLTLMALRYVDEASLSGRLKWFVRLSLPSAAIIMAVGFFFSVMKPHPAEPSSIICLTYAGGVLLAAGVVVLGIGLIKAPSA